MLTLEHPGSSAIPLGECLSTCYVVGMGLFDFFSAKKPAATGTHVDGSCPCEAHQAAGVEKLTQGDFRGALVSFDEAIRVCPTNHKAWGNRGICLRELGNHDEAMTSLNGAISLKPDYGIAWENKGILLVKLRREDEALSCFKTSWSRDPSRAMPRIRAARIYIDREQFDDAIAQLRTALKAEPGNGTAMAKMALAMHLKGDRDAAREVYANALKLSPADPELLTNYGTLFEDLKQPDRAIEFYRKALKVNPENRAARLNLERIQSVVAARTSVPMAPPQKDPQTEVTTALRDALIAAAREMNCVPADHVEYPQALVTRGREVATTLMTLLGRASEKQLANAGQLLLHLFGYAFLEGMNDAYQQTGSSDGAGLPPLNVDHALTRQATCPAMPPDVAKIERGCPAPMDMLLALEKWRVGNQKEMQAAGMNRSGAMQLGLFWSYIMGVNRALMQLGRIPAHGKPQLAAPPLEVHPPSAKADPRPKNDSAEALISEAQRLGLINGRDLGFIKEVLPMFGEPCRMFHQIAIDGMTKAAAAGDPLSGLALMQRSCMYLFGKGVQAVMVWGTTSDGKFGLDFEPSEMIQMSLGPSPELSPEQNKTAADSMQYGVPLFAAHQAFMEAVMPTLPAVDEAFVRAEMLKTLQWVPRIAISYGLMKGYHETLSRPEEGAVPNLEPIDFENRQLQADLSKLAVTKIVDDKNQNRVVYCARVEPSGARQTAEYRENSAAAYELYVITDQAGEVLDINHRVQHCLNASRSFAPHEAPAHMFPAKAMFDLDWEDIAPSAQAVFVKLLTDMTVEPE